MASSRKAGDVPFALDGDRQGSGPERGSALLDVLLAAGLVALAVGAVVGGTLAALKATYRARDLHAASLAAQGRIEELRALPAAELAALPGKPDPPFGGWAAWTEGGFTGAVGTVVYRVYVSDCAGGCDGLPAAGLFRARVVFARDHGGVAEDFLTETAYLRPADAGG